MDSDGEGGISVDREERVIDRKDVTGMKNEYDMSYLLRKCPTLDYSITLTAWN